MDPVQDEIKYGYGSHTERSEKRVREDIESGYGFSYWNKLNTGTVSVREEVKSGYEKILRADIVFRTRRN